VSALAIAFSFSSFACPLALRGLHSFPTRRSSDLRTGEVSCDRAADAIADLTDFDLHRHPHLDFLNRGWKLRENVTAYDAMYIALDRKSTRLNSSHRTISYAVFCLKKKKTNKARAA